MLAVSAALLLSFSTAASGVLAQSSTTGSEGTWTARYAGKRGEAPDKTRVYLQFNYDHSNNGNTWPASSLPGLNLDQDADNIKIDLRREAGTITLTGDVRRGRAFGIFDFTPNANFAQEIGAMPGRRTLTPERLLSLAIHDVSRAYIQRLDALGYKNLDVDDLLAMRIHGVTPEFISEMRKLGVTSLDHEKLVAFRIHGVTPDFVRRMETAGFKILDDDDLVSARIHGVSPEFLDEMQKLGYKAMDFDDLVSFRIHGVTPDFIAEMAAEGYKDLSPDRLVEFRIHGIDAEFVKDLKEQGYTGLSSRDLVDARIHGRRWMRKRPAGGGAE
jgi:hypothetical protein